MTCQDDGKNVSVQKENIFKMSVRVFGDSDTYTVL
jgi:hypothetical protein